MRPLIKKTIGINTYRHIYGDNGHVWRPWARMDIYKLTRIDTYAQVCTRDDVTGLIVILEQCRLMDLRSLEMVIK